MGARQVGGRKAPPFPPMGQRGVVRLVAQVVGPAHQGGYTHVVFPLCGMDETWGCLDARPSERFAHTESEILGIDTLARHAA